MLVSAVSCPGTFSQRDPPLLLPCLTAPSLLDFAGWLVDVFATGDAGSGRGCKGGEGRRDVGNTGSARGSDLALVANLKATGPGTSGFPAVASAQQQQLAPDAPS